MLLCSAICLFLFPNRDERHYGVGFAQGSLCNVKFVCLSLSSISICVLYHIAASASHIAACIIYRPKGHMCVLCIITLSFEAELCQQTFEDPPPTHTHTSTPSCMFLSTLEPSALTTTNLQAFASLGWWSDFLAPTSSAAGAGVACVSDPAKITPHYPNETLARTASVARAAQAGP